MQEIWKDIEGYEGLYQVSNLGIVKSLPRQYKNRKCNERIKSPSLAGKGYYRVSLCKNGIIKYYYIHQLVAKTFIPNPNNYKLVNHKDENKLNNCVDNLEWCDYKYNLNYNNGKIKRLLSRIQYYMKQQNRYDVINKIDEIKEIL